MNRRLSVEEFLSMERGACPLCGAVIAVIEGENTVTYRCETCKVEHRAVYTRVTATFDVNDGPSGE